MDTVNEGSPVMGTVIKGTVVMSTVIVGTIVMGTVLGDTAVLVTVINLLFSRVLSLTSKTIDKKCVNNSDKGLDKRQSFLFKIIQLKFQ